ncbi:MAG TPA: C25 family cysteine peptidase [Blastocatellia bacterium]|nr:C25 family cysteine peptidase [Blastocatellia bacterium]
MSTDGTSWVAASQTPTSANDSITVRSTHTVTVTANVDADQLTVDSSSTLSVNNGVTFTIADGTGTDLTDNGTVATAGTITNNGQVTINDTLQINQGGFPGSGTGTYAYNATTGNLVFNNSSGAYGVNNDAYWPAASGPANVTVQGAGGIMMNVARTVSGLFQYAAGVFGANNLTLNGTSLVNNGGFMSGSPTYGSASLLKYNTGGSYGRNGEWLPNVTSGAGYPAYVQLANNTTLDLPNGSSGAFFQMSLNLTIDLGSTLQMAGVPAMTQPLIVLGDVNLFGTLQLSTAIGGDLKVGGNWTNFGTLTSNNRAVFFNGTMNQSIGGMPTTFAYLIISNTGASGSNTVSLGANTTVSAALNINSGVFDQGATFNLTTNTVTVSSGAKWQDVGSGAVTLSGDVANNSGTITFNGGTAACGEADAILIRSSVTGTQRLWSATGTPVFNMTDVDVKDQAGSAGIVVLSGTDSGNNGSNWAIGSSCTPTEVTLESFTASRYDDGVALEWRTGREVANLGFNLYREQGGQRTRLTPQLIAGSALAVGARTLLMAGNAYQWWDDAPAAKGTQYWLEAVDLDGQSTWTGPVAIASSVPPDRLPPAGRSRLLSDLAKDTRRDATSRLERRAAMPVVGAQSSARPAALATQTALKLTIKQEGWYRVTQPELLRAGLDAKVDPRILQLFVDGKQQPMLVRGEQDGQFDAADAIEFYGVGLDESFTDARVYWLVVGSEAGARVKTVKGKGRKAIDASLFTAERKDRTIYFSALRNGEKENFFGDVVSKSPIEQSLNLAHVDNSSPAEATLEVTLQGVTELPHRVQVEFNGRRLGEMTFANQSAGVAKFAVAHSEIREGNNSVKLSAIGGDSDVSLVDRLRLTYRHTLIADENALPMAAGNKQQVTISGFSNAQVHVFDVTDTDAPAEVIAQVEPRTDGYAISFGTPKGGERNLLAIAEDQFKRPASIAVDQLSSLRDKQQQADLVIITRREFFAAVEPLRQARQAQGLRVTVVDVEDIYDEFSFGHKSPYAVRDFLSYAKSNWQRAPTAVLLVGDACVDPKNYLGNGDNDFVPTKLIDTTFLETASDDWFADFNETGLAEMAVGRLPVRTGEEAAAMIARIIAYGSAAKAESVLLVADSRDGGIDFDTATTNLRPLIPDDMAVEILHRGSMDAMAARGSLLDSLGRGQRIVNYAGHGSVDLWRGGLLTGGDARRLASSATLSVFVMMTCLNGYFQDASLEGLAESLMKADHGAVAVWASSGMSGVQPQTKMNQELFRLLFGTNRRSLTLGEATMKAKAAITDSDVRRTWILFGDPTTRLY